MGLADATSESRRARGCPRLASGARVVQAPTATGYLNLSLTVRAPLARAQICKDAWALLSKRIHELEQGAVGGRRRAPVPPPAMTLASCAAPRAARMLRRVAAPAGGRGAARAALRLRGRAEAAPDSQRRPRLLLARAGCLVWGGSSAGDPQEVAHGTTVRRRSCRHAVLHGSRSPKT